VVWHGSNAATDGDWFRSDDLTRRLRNLTTAVTDWAHGGRNPEAREMRALIRQLKAETKRIIEDV
jgi:hypothetical protein